jgi:cation:H+ antiporter
MKTAWLALLTGQGVLLPLLALGLAGALVYLLAARLARDADAIATATGLGGLWIGSVVLAASTSLPEILTNLSAAVLDAPDVGVGDLLGAALANMLILATLDLVYARRRILHQVAAEHALLGLLGIVLAAIVGSALLARGWGRVGHVGVDTLAIGLVYTAGMWLVYRSLAAAPVAPAVRERAGHPGAAAVRFGVAATGLALVTPFLVVGAEAFALESGLSEAAVGTLFVGVATSFPELAATVSAVRLGALDLAVGNVFGSVAFNMVVLLVLDAAYPRGPLLAVAGRDHASTVFVVVACVALGVMGILSRAQRRPGPVVVESALIVAAYAVGAWLLLAAALAARP